MTFTVNCDDKVIKENIENSLQNYTLRFSEIDNDNATSIFNGAVRQIHAALEPFGYFNPEINKELLKGQGDLWFATFKIKLGQRAIIRNVFVSFKGEKIPHLNEELQKLKHLKSTLYDGGTIRVLQNNILKQFHKAGFITADANDSFYRINGKNIDLYFVFQSNQLFSYGPITLKNKTKLNNQLIRRYFKFKPGDPFDADEMNELQEDLMKSNYFSQVMVKQQRSTHQEQIPVEVDLEKNKSVHTTYSFGYDSHYHLGGGLGFFVNPLNAYGHSLKFISRISTNNFYNFFFLYSIPGLDPITTHYLYSLDFINLDLIDGTSKRASLSMGRRYQHQGRVIEPSINFALERSEPDNEASYTSHLFYPRLELGYQYRSKKNWISFFKTNFDSLVASEKILSDLSIARFNIHSEIMIPIAMLTLRMTNDLGQLSSSDLNDVPLSLNFYTGGPDSVRGYQFNSIGPGKYLKNITYELQFPIRPPWKFIIFQDHGVASNEWDTHMKVGTGVGLLWDLDFVGVKLTFAKAKDDPGQPLRFQLSVQSM